MTFGDGAQSSRARPAAVASAHKRAATLRRMLGTRLVTATSSSSMGRRWGCRLRCRADCRWEAPSSCILDMFRDALVNCVLFSQLGGLWVEMTSSRAASAVQFCGTTAQGPNGAAPRRVRAINFLALVPLSASFYALDAPCISAHSANYKFLGVGDSPACSQYSAAPAARRVRSPTGPQQLHTNCATSH